MAAYAAAVSLLRALPQPPASLYDYCLQFRVLAQLGEAYVGVFLTTEKLRGKVDSLKLFLEDNREVKREFETQIRESIYEAQDIFDNHLWSTWSFLSPSEAEMTTTCEDLERVEQKISSIVEMTTEEFNRQTLDRKISNSVWKPSDENHYAKIIPLVGRSEDFNQLKDRLMGGSAGLEVISIVGITGIGKTALAHNLLDDPSIRKHFDATGLVRICINYNKRNTLLDLLGSIKERAAGIRINRFVKSQYKWSDAILQKKNDELVKLLYDSLRHKRYLILLDDIRDVAIWNELNKLFPDFHNGSRILITTRNVDVASACCPHELGFLSDEDTLALLEAIVFHGLPCPSHLADIAEKIARRCRGFPHAVGIVGRLFMFANPIAEYWGMVLSSIDTCGSHADLMEALMLLTYNHLPQELKVCLLYAAIFPYTYVIRFMNFINLSTAERFRERPKTTLESLERLIWRGFFVQHVKSGVFSRFEIAEEVFHDFLVRKAKDEKFFLVIKKDTSYDFVQEDAIYNQQRRLTIQQNIYRFIQDLSKYSSNSSVRSLLYYGPKNQIPIGEWSEEFKLLEIFDVDEVSFYTFPLGILKSVLLRYLALSYNRQLPATLCNLRNLQILIVSQFRNLKCSGVPSYLPAEFWNLEGLSYLQVMGSDLPEPPAGNEPLLKYLQNLLNVSSHSCTRNILERLTNLQVLRVRIESSPEDEPLSFFSHLDILQNLITFKCVVLYPDIKAQVVPSSIPAFSDTLMKLSLSGCGFPWEYMRAIATLPNLATLKLKTYAFQGQEWEVKANEFTKLEFLLLEDLDLEKWTFASSSSFPALRSLIINHCYKLQDIPLVFADSPALEILEVVDCSTSAMNSALEIKEKILNQGRHSTRFDIYSSKYD